MFFTSNLNNHFKKTENDNVDFGETVTILLLGLPYIVDFTSGLCSFMLAFSIFEHEEEQEEKEKAKVTYTLFYKIYYL